MPKPWNMQILQIKKKSQEVHSDKAGETTDSHRQVTDFPAGLDEIIQALYDTSNQLWEVFSNMPLEWTRTTFQCMPAVSRVWNLENYYATVTILTQRQKPQDKHFNNGK